MTDISRRAFLKLAAGGSAVLAADFGGKTVDRLIPYVVKPEQARPGVWTIYATTCRECPAGCGMHVRHTNGRIVKPEGNPHHPVNRGGLCPRGQSAPQGLYDPDCLKQVFHQKTQATWQDAFSQIGRRLKESKGKVALISDLQTGTLAEIMSLFTKGFGSDRILLYEPFNYEGLRQAHQDLFGLPIIPCYNLDSCETILSFGADFLETWVSNVQFAHEFSRMRAYNDGRMGHFIYVGPRLSMTAANADDFVQVAPGHMHRIALAILNVMLDKGWAKEDAGNLKAVVKDYDAQKIAKEAGTSPDLLYRIAQSFAQAKASVALAGPTPDESPAARALATAVGLLNHAAGRIGQTVDFSRPHALSLTATNEQMNKFLGELTANDILFIHRANPVYTHPGAADRLRKAGTIVYMGVMPDETAEVADWVLPVDYPLVAWGDYEPWKGYHSLLQPTMARLYDTRNPGDILLTLARAAGKPLQRSGKTPTDFEEWLNLRWQEIHGKKAGLQPFSEFWTQALRAGGVWEDSQPAKVSLKADMATLHFSQASTKPATAPAAVELWLWPNILMFDGRTSNRSWIQEVPEPVSNLAWNSCVDVHPKTAQSLGLGPADVVELSTPAGKVEVAVRVTEDVHEQVVALAFGQGHTALGHLAAGRGANAFRLTDGKPAPDAMFGHVKIVKTGKTFMPVYMYPTQEQHHRDILQWISLASLKAMKSGQGVPLTMPLPEGYQKDKDLYDPHPYRKHRWAMAVDLHRCIGCKSCEVACYAENNIGVVGEERVRQGREMSWLLIPPYRDQDNHKRVGFLPMLCQHCDAAPCEPVCPVFASVHNDEGLNAQIYNRCVGTRYCNNNCPYKVRRFNWLNYTWPKPLDWQLNPDVTVRCRGVMEKCTFCIQRIREVEWRARREDREVRDGEIQPACVQSCPAQVYTFGDLLDPNSKISKIFREDPRRYQVLQDLNTKPAIAYLKRIKRDEAVIT